jgi:hypothetical protein
VTMLTANPHATVTAKQRIGAGDATYLARES